MENTLVRIDCRTIRDWESLHHVFAEAFGFPSFYGHNGNAWIDCMSSLDSPEDGMTTIHTARGHVVVIQLDYVREFECGCPELFAALSDWCAFVNWRRIEMGDEPILALSFHRSE